MQHRQHTFALRAYYGDTDAGGVVYHARYLEFFERARYECFAAYGLDVATLAASGVSFVVVEAQVRYRAPARLGDALQVVTQIIERRPASLRLQQQLHRAGETELLCEAQIRLACLGAQFKPQPLPKNILDKLE